MIHADEVKFYLDHINPNATAEEMARFLKVAHKSVNSVLRRKGHGDLADRLVNNAIRAGFNVQLKEES